MCGEVLRRMCGEVQRRMCGEVQRRMCGEVLLLLSSGRVPGFPGGKGPGPFYSIYNRCQSENHCPSGVKR